MKISIVKLLSGYYYARGSGFNDFAQWRTDEQLKESDFFNQAGEQFKHALRKKLKWISRQGIL
jgi:hypothetical protein